MEQYKVILVDDEEEVIDVDAGIRFAGMNWDLKW